ncbi:MAG: CBS domain-containing protein [Geminicoccaceae bacterium]|nr:MAG: CBS domain-containing protein [Geminicoccaceae bacterium]
MYVEDIMQTHPTAIQRKAKLREAIDLMAQRHIQAVLVVDENNRFIGEFSAIQLAKILLPPNARAFVGAHANPREDEKIPDLVARLRPYLDRPVGDFIDHDIPTVHPKTPLSEALLLLRGGALRMPVTEGPDDRLVGAVSVLTVLRKVAEDAEL